MRPLRGSVRACLFLALLLVAGAGCGGDGGSGSNGSWGGDGDVGGNTGTGAEVATGDNQIQPTTGKAAFDSPEGNYRVVWPEGCSQLRTRTQSDQSNGDPDTLILANTFCDREDRDNEGCSVTTYFHPRADDGGPPTSRTVIEICKKAMEKFGVTISTQRPIRRGVVEGIQLHCKEPDQTGEVWLEGLLAGERIYILMAWRANGELFTNPEFMNFFASFALTNYPD